MLVEVESTVFFQYVDSLICRDFQTVDTTLLAPIIEAMKPVANISVESQVTDMLFLLKCSTPLNLLVLSPVWLVIL